MRDAGGAGVCSAGVGMQMGTPNGAWLQRKETAAGFLRGEGVRVGGSARWEIKTELEMGKTTSFVFGLFFLWLGAQPLWAASGSERIPRAFQDSAFEALFENRGEAVFQFIESDPARAEAAGLLVSLDARKDSLFTAYANKRELAAFLQAGYKIHALLESPAALAARKKAAAMAGSREEMAGWDRYPTYPLYVEMMQAFAREHPDICRLDTIGYSVENRLILCLKISDSVNREEPEPGFFYSSSIHGDELTGYVLMLRLADYLLRSYGQDEEVTRLVDGMQIYINPLANPDGAYALSDQDVSGSTRYNANYEDLNRNFPDFWYGSSSRVEKENRAMISYVDTLHLVVSANIHGGSDVLNYPWDGFRSSQRRHADYLWWQSVCKRYVDSCRRVDPASYRDVNAQGYIHGGDWYVVHNGRQDYFNVYNHLRELTLEISVTKLPAASLLPDFWETNWRSLVNYMKEAGYGIRGTVRDSLTGEPLRAFVQVLGHDKDSSQVYSSAVHGAYFRPIAEGGYSLNFSAPGYRDKTVENIEVSDFSYTVCNVALVPDSLPAPPDTIPSDTTVSNAFLADAGSGTGDAGVFRLYPNPVSGTLYLEAVEPVALVAVYRASDGRKAMGLPEGGMRVSHRLSVEALPVGLYVLEVKSADGKRHRIRFVKY